MYGFTPSITGPALLGEFVADADGLPAVEFPFDFCVRLVTPRGDGTGLVGIVEAEVAGWADLALLARLGRPLLRLASSALPLEDLGNSDNLLLII